MLDSVRFRRLQFVISYKVTSNNVAIVFNVQFFISVLLIPDRTELFIKSQNKGQTGIQEFFY